jgi:hypothetical protein
MADQASGGHILTGRYSSEVKKSIYGPEVEFSIGRIIASFPFVHLYSVQMENGGSIMATAETKSAVPIGVRENTVYPPNSKVLVARLPGDSLGHIVCAFSSAELPGSLFVSDYVQPGSNVGLKIGEAYKHIFKTLGEQFKTYPRTSGRALDTLGGEFSKITETGLSFLMDSFQIAMQVNPSCGLWLNYFDSYLKLAAQTYDFYSYALHSQHRNDEGEIYQHDGYVIYPWEAVGAADPNSETVMLHPSSSVQLNPNEPFYDSDVQSLDSQPIYRLEQYRGYLGQGEQTFVSLPSTKSGLNNRQSSQPNTGLFHRHIGLDGSFAVRSAKEILLYKYPKIVIPKKQFDPESPFGDDTQTSGYDSSGLNSPEFKDWSKLADGDRVAAGGSMIEKLAQHFGWKSQNAFFKHQYDFRLRSEAEISETGLKFYVGKKAESHVFPEDPKSLEIDHRYKEVHYFNTAAGIGLLDDGSVVIECGFGSRILMSHGQIRLEAGGDIMFMSRSRVVTLADESITRVKSSCDISTTSGDVRIRSGGNLQTCSTKGTLIESKGFGIDQDYRDKIGEEVQSTGITLLAKSSVISSLAQTLYFRTGVLDGLAEGSGDVVFDVANGKSNFACYANEAAFFARRSLGVYFGPSGQESEEVNAGHILGRNTVELGTSATIKGNIVTPGGSVVVNGGVFAQRIDSSGTLSSGSGEVAKNKDIDRFISSFSESVSSYAESEINFRSQVFTSTIKDVWWGENRPGNTQFLENEIGFSFRDTSAREGGDVYGYSKFQLLETRWQQLVRLNLVSGISQNWAERPVSYQNQLLYPWPGKKYWQDDDILVQCGEQSTSLFTLQGIKNLPQNEELFLSPRLSVTVANCEQNYRM